MKSLMVWYHHQVVITGDQLSCCITKEDIHQAGSKETTEDIHQAGSHSIRTYLSGTAAVKATSFAACAFGCCFGRKTSPPSVSRQRLTALSWRQWPWYHVPPSDSWDAEAWLRKFWNKRKKEEKKKEKTNLPKVASMVFDGLYIPGERGWVNYGWDYIIYIILCTCSGW